MQYLKAIWDEHRQLGNWLPTREIKVGDVGTWDRDAGFSKITSLGEMRLGFNSVRSPYGGGTLESSSGYAVKPEADVDLSALGQGEVQLQFAQKGSFALRAEGCTVATIDGADKVFQRIKVRVQTKGWDERYVVITEVVSAQTATLLVSKDRDVSVTATGLSSAGGLISADFTVTGQSHRLTTFVAESGLTLMFKGFRISKPFLRRLAARPAVFDIGDDGVGPLETVDVEY